MHAPIKHNTQRGFSKTVLIVLISVGFILVVTVIAAFLLTPNLKKARMAANESAAFAAVRNINVGQVTYDASYSNGFAPDLASLGPGPDSSPASPCPSGSTPAHACLIDAVLGNPACTGTSWCTLSNYKFNLQGVCVDGKCADYVITATPVSADTGSKNFCSTNNNVVRSEEAAPRSEPFTAQACQALSAMQ